MTSASVAAPDQPLCAVLPFGGAADAVEAHNLALLTEEYARRLEQTGRCRVLAGPALRRRLGGRRPPPVSLHGNLAEAGLAAARGLPVDLVVAGRVVRNGNLRILHTTLVNARTLQAVQSVQSRYTGPVDRFVRLTPASNIPVLFGIESSAAAGPGRRPAGPAAARRTPAAQTAPSAERRSPSAWSEWKERFTAWQRGPSEPAASRLPGPLRYIEDHLEAGLRSVRFSLEDTDGAFLGTINHLSAEQDSSFDRLFLRWWFVRYAGVEWTTDKVAARTRTSVGHSDGTIKAAGSLFSALARYPFEVPVDRYTVQVIPYAGLGYAKMDLDFEPVPWWALGYASAQHWASSGYAASHYDDLTRAITLTDASGIALIGGLAVRVWEGVTLEFYMRELDLDTDARYTRRRPGQTGEIQHGTFPLSSRAYGFGLSYAF